MGTASQEPSLDLVMLLARGIDPALDDLQVVAHNPVQGEAMHKVLGYHAAKALLDAGWTVTPPR
jgi:hypothetical protein